MQIISDELDKLIAKYYLADLSFYFSRNTDNRINYGPTLENMVYIYARSHDYSVSIGKAGKFEIIKDNYPKYVTTTDFLL